MHRVLVNLLTNAIKFSPLSGKITVSAQIENQNDLKISVQDNGLGISSERQKTIFDRYQSEAQHDSLVLSTGLGLSFCKLAIESHGGDITVESKEMKGSKFIIRLPLSNSLSVGNQIAPKEIIQFSKGELLLDKSDIEIILKYIDELKGFEVYQVSDIFKTLNQISMNESSKLQTWVMMVTDSVLLCQQSRYAELINISKNE